MKIVQYTKGSDKKQSQYQLPKNKNSIDYNKRCVSWKIGGGGRYARKIDELEKGVYKNSYGQIIKEPSKYGFCSNPDKTTRGNWCYTDKQGNREYCCPKGETCHSYTGVTCKRWNRTRSGRSQYDKNPTHKEWLNNPDARYQNTCLNPDNSKGKWCYTSNNGAWEYLSLIHI